MCNRENKGEHTSSYMCVHQHSLVNTAELMVQTPVRFRTPSQASSQQGSTYLPINTEAAGCRLFTPGESKQAWHRAGHFATPHSQPTLSKDITAPFHQLSDGRLSLVHLRETREVIARELWAFASTSWSTGCQGECGNLAQRWWKIAG